MILVTGATGHIGNVLVRELVARGEEVRALVLPGESCDSLKGLPIEMVVGNILDPETLDRWMRGVKLVYHLAGVISIVPGKEELMYRVNVEGARNVARAALKAKARMVHTASVHALRREPHGVTMDERTPLALEGDAGAYDRTKAEGVQAVLEVVREGLDAVIVCPSGVIGPHDYFHSEMGELLRTFATPKIHFIINGAYDFVDVRDVAQGMILAAEKGRTGEIYILSGEQVTLRWLLKKTQQIAGVRSPAVVLPHNLALFFSSTPTIFTACFIKHRSSPPTLFRPWPAIPASAGPRRKKSSATARAPWKNRSAITWPGEKSITINATGKRVAGPGPALGRREERETRARH